MALSSRWLTGVLVVALASASAVFAREKEDDPLLAKLIIGELEVRNTEGADATAWDLDLWVGKDLHKLWIKSEGNRAGGETEKGEWQLLYNRAASAFWDFQIGWRKDWRPKPQRDYLVVGFEGLAPYFLEVETALFLREIDRPAFRITVDYELLFTQRLILEPEVELNFHGYNDPGVGVGAGLSSVEIGLRLHYGVTRQFAPYIGVIWEKKSGDTADYAREEGERTEEVQWIAGISAWF